MNKKVTSIIERQYEMFYAASASGTEYIPPITYKKKNTPRDIRKEMVTGYMKLLNKK
ncbi:hypothetical protein LCM23_12925 [Cytobacillus kochii]|uniref:hypothetical protein n=1 Tax=Cytobacillus kochii TaxID=859143 RepID=UPI001CD6ECCF|nr:hypothetical protein [Cytobacillus kochii]MCA1026997.1 hypothetical protein [Cytobacillus kochii]